jgi:prepilin-type N-terminal cleavage/methylation domain-containing protein
MTRQAGLTLVELMVALLLAAILSAGLFAMTSGQTASYNSQLKSVTVQQNLWGAMEYLQRQIRTAGYGFGGCPGGKIQAFTGGVPDPNAIIGLAVNNDCSTFKDVTCTAASHGVDSLLVNYSVGVFDGDMPAIRITKWQNDVTAYADSCNGLSDGDVIAMWDPSQPDTACTLLTATDVTDTSGKKSTKDCKIKHNSGSGNDPLGLNPPGGAGVPIYNPGSLIVKMPASRDPMRFAIDVDHDPPRLMQWRGGAPTATAEVVAEGIEDMQIAWACDYAGGPDGILTEGTDAASRQTDEWAYNEAGDTVPTCIYPSPCTPGVDCHQAPIAAVRITLIGRTASVEPGAKTGNRPAAEDHAVGSSDWTASSKLGSYGRAIITTTIKPRNLVR